MEMICSLCDETVFFYFTVSHKGSISCMSRTGFGFNQGQKPIENQRFSRKIIRRQILSNLTSYYGCLLLNGVQTRVLLPEGV